MDWKTFEQSLEAPAPPPGLPPLLEALWWDARGDWDRAHRIAQDVDGPLGARVHAYLHRKEGDLWNADWWYRRAGTSRPHHPLHTEWKLLVEELLPTRS